MSAFCHWLTRSLNRRVQSPPPPPCLTTTNLTTTSPVHTAWLNGPHIANNSITHPLLELLVHIQGPQEAPQESQSRRQGRPISGLAAEEEGYQDLSDRVDGMGASILRVACRCKVSLMSASRVLPLVRNLGVIVSLVSCHFITKSRPYYGSCFYASVPL
jgi:hypothetical protein